ncbi:hypothetical protein ACEQ8H_002404 [Pleosporales sp. CAS-2024a]
MLRTLATRVPRRYFSVATARRVQQYPNNSSTDASVETDAYPDDKHAVNKAQEGETANIQEANAKAGMDNKNKASGGNATEQRDSAGGKEKAKKEFPEAPDVAIGMQDERGGKGS